MDIANYPSLSGDEFVEACHHLDRAYCQATLGPLRKVWKLRLRTVVRKNFAIEEMPSSYIEITRPIETNSQGDLDIDLDSLVLSEDQEMMEIEASDEAAIKKPSQRRDYGLVTYEIHLHPTYRMPCLWFQIRGLETGESRFDLDTVFHYLVPHQYKEGLKRYGGVGGISMDHHPLHGEPWFFVHPCLTGDNMSAFSCSLQEYLTVWLGMVGGCVGLWVPRQMINGQ